MYQLSFSILFLIACTVGGAFIGPGVFNHAWAAVFGAVAGLVISMIIVIAERLLEREPLRVLLGGLVGIVLGVSLTFLLQGLGVFGSNSAVAFPLSLAGFLYLGVNLGVKKARDLDWAAGKKRDEKHGRNNYKVLDTSVIIDGRIADVCETGFVEGIFVIPQFILHELQHIADSSDPTKRTRGRRGLDVLQKVQRQKDVMVKITDHEFPEIRDVDSKLIALAKKLKGKVITNDFNLNKVAELQGVPVLNINKLSNALKPVVLPGEIMKVQILKEGKEEGQGVAYLDDGTMVVVDNAVQHVGRNIDVAVTSVLQTTPGRMIFTSIKEEPQGGKYHSGLHS